LRVLHDAHAHVGRSQVPIHVAKKRARVSQRSEGEKTVISRRRAWTD
jgi:hypothetical protein